MLTGDTQQEASRISQELGIILTASSATPEVKLQHIKNLQSRGHKVMMVGDGMNDGPSLAASDVGVMMAHGRKCLSSGGSVLILQSQLQALRILLDISRSTMRQVSFNIIWALSYNVVAVALAIGMGESFGLTISP
jgi:P-type E1-E2 ATPase